jgi:hypothetical protein
MFNQEFKFFIDNQDRLVQQYGGKILIIKGESVIGVFDNVMDAYKNLQEEGQLGKAMIQSCIAGKDAYTLSVTSVGVIG